MRLASPYALLLLLFVPVLLYLCQQQRYSVAVRYSSIADLVALSPSLATRLRWVLPCLPRAMIALAIAVSGGILFSASLFWIGYYSLVVHEMVCAGLVVGWLLLFTRSLAAAERAASAAAEASAGS